jgi:hypothetical protein
MAKNHLTAQELEDLIFRYTSEARKLAFQLKQVEETVAELQRQLPKVASTEPKPTPAKAKAEKPAAPKKKRGRPSKAKVEKEVVAEAEAEAETKVKAETETTTAETAPKRKRGRPKKEKTAAAGRKTSAKKLRTAQEEASQPKGYRLSDWDMFIINSIKRANKVLVNSDLMDKALNRVKKEKMDLDEMALRGKLNRSIHKLANRRGDLVKVDYPGKGFAYGLPEWTDESGEIRAEFIENSN